MRKLLGTVVVVAVLAAGSAYAADAASGFGASLRLGYGIPMGSVSGNAGADLSRFFSGQLPLQLDLGYRFNPYVSAAVFGQYAFNFISSDLGCTGTVSCSGHDIRTGLELFIHPVPGAGRIDPWFGVGRGTSGPRCRRPGPAAAVI